MYSPTSSLLPTQLPQIISSGSIYRRWGARGIKTRHLVINVLLLALATGFSSTAAGQSGPQLCNDVDPSQPDLFVGNYATNRITRVSPNGAGGTTVSPLHDATSGSPVNFSHVFDLAFAPPGSDFDCGSNDPAECSRVLYASPNRRVTLNDDGDVIQNIVIPNVSANFGLAFGPPQDPWDGDLFVVDCCTNEPHLPFLTGVISRVTPNGTGGFTVTEFATGRPNTYQYLVSSSAADGGLGALFVSAVHDATWGSPNFGPWGIDMVKADSSLHNQFVTPVAEGMAFDANGNLFVVNWNEVRTLGPTTISIISADDIVTPPTPPHTVSVVLSNTSGSEVNFSSAPTLAFDPSGYLYVAESGTSSILRLTLNGDVVTANGAVVTETCTYATGITNPRGMEFAALQPGATIYTQTPQGSLPAHSLDGLNWTNLRTVIENAGNTIDSFSDPAAFADYNTMLGYSTIWVDAEWQSSLTADEIASLQRYYAEKNAEVLVIMDTQWHSDDFLGILDNERFTTNIANWIADTATNKIVLIGENGHHTWIDWNDSIMQVVGGSWGAASPCGSVVGEPTSDHILTDGVTQTKGQCMSFVTPTAGNPDILFSNGLAAIYTNSVANPDNDNDGIPDDEDPDDDNDGFEDTLEGTCATDPFDENSIPTGSLAGTVTLGGSGLSGVLVKLLDESGQTVVGDDSTDTAGSYSFADVPAGNYVVMIVEPIGTSSAPEVEGVPITCNETAQVNFVLTSNVVVNEARSKGYWKHQFDVATCAGNKCKANAHETTGDLQSYLDEIRDRYWPHFMAVVNEETDGQGDDLAEWHALLSVKGKAGMAANAEAQLGALALNIMSLKVSQFEVVTEDGKTAGDVLTYASELLTDAYASNDEMAKDLAERVNTQDLLIEAGLVTPSQSIAYKTEEAIPEQYDLEQNYPNPFNPATTLTVLLPETADVRLVVYDLLGRTVAVPLEGSHEAGRHSVTFEAGSLPSGVYIYRLQAGDFESTKRMTLLR